MEAAAPTEISYVRVHPKHLPSVLSDHARRVADTAYHLAVEAGLNWRERIETQQIALLHELELLETSITTAHPDTTPIRAWIAVDPLNNRGDLIPGNLPPAVRDGVRRIQRWNGQDSSGTLCSVRLTLPLRMIAVADAYDVLMMCQTGPDRERCRNVICELRRQAESRLDPEIVQALISLIHLVPTGYSPEAGRPRPPYGP